MSQSQPDSSPTPDPPALLDRYQAEIDAALRAEFTARDLPLYDTLRYHMGWQDADGRPTATGGGKRLRPTLCLLACEAVGGDRTRALPAAVALEFVHNFSLIHDDVEDGDRYRRHRLTVWAVWDEPTAIAAGNLLLTMGNLAMRRLVDRGVSPHVAAEAARVFTESYLRMMEGQYLDIEFEDRLDITVDDYLDMIARKTGALIEVSLFLGALAGSSDQADRSLADGLRAVGRELGAVFQIRDDILGVWGGEATGKPVAADIERRKK
ncbi:MAG: polyprenyl synthetase family protein, partial [Chloroflexi bacterium]|nr:polyprenyl synthetase family protein [Chloroflexota bacterium]